MIYYLRKGPSIIGDYYDNHLEKLCQKIIFHHHNIRPHTRVVSIVKICKFHNHHIYPIWLPWTFIYFHLPWSHQTIEYTPLRRFYPCEFQHAIQKGQHKFTFKCKDTPAAHDVISCWEPLTVVRSKLSLFKNVSVTLSLLTNCVCYQISFSLLLNAVW